MARFLPDNFYENLPESAELAWAKALEFGVKFVDDHVSQESSVEYDDQFRLEVINFLTDLAEELGLKIDSQMLSPDLVLYERLNVAQSHANRLVGREGIRRISQRYGTIDSVPVDEPVKSLSAKTKMEIINLSRDLKKSVADSDLAQKHKTRLLGQLEKFEQDLIVGRSSLKDAVLAIAMIGGAVATATGTLAAAPTALETIGKISGLIGYEIEQQKELKQLTSEENLTASPTLIGSPDNDQGPK